MARIRTVKPEFWQHPVMSRQADEVRLAAVALLNLADDEGYFMAEPGLIRSFMWPLTESSVKAHGVLTTLFKIGWIEVCKHPTHGALGRVVNFAKHQLVNRPSPSKLKTYWITESSVNDHGVLTEDSQPDQGSGNREQGTGNREHDTPAPAARARRARRVKTPESECVGRHAFKLKGSADEKKAALRAAIDQFGIDAVDAADLNGAWASEVLTRLDGASHQLDSSPGPSAEGLAELRAETIKLRAAGKIR